MAEINSILSNTLLSGTSGDDFIQNGGEWSDSFHDGGSNVTINTGEGDDSISLYSLGSKENVIIYNSGDCNDIIYGFRTDSTLSISGDSYSTAISGSDVIITVGDGQISLIGAVSKISDSNIVFTQTTPVETNSWTISGANYAYKKVSATEGYTLSNNQIIYAPAGEGVTLAELGGGNDSILNNAKNVEISGGEGKDKITNNAPPTFQSSAAKEMIILLSAVAGTAILLFTNRVTAKI